MAWKETGTGPVEYAAPDCLERFEKFFGLKKIDWAVKSGVIKGVERHGVGFRALFGFDNQNSFAIWLTARGSQEAFLFQTKHLDVSIEGSEITALARHFTMSLRVAIGNARMEDMAAIFTAGAAPERDERPAGEIVREIISGSGDWGRADQWRQFFCESEVENDLLLEDGYTFTAGCSVIHHTDLECVYVRPPSTMRFADFNNTFWGDSLKLPPRGFHFTDLKEGDIVMGGAEKLGAALDAAARNGDGGIVAVTSCCIPMLIGDDVEAEVERFRGKSERPVLLTDQMTRDPYARIAETIVGMIDRDAPGRAPVKPRSYNLSGFAPRRDCFELVELLGAAGMELNEILFPVIDPEGLKRYPAAEVQVFMPLKVCGSVYRALERLPVKAVMPPAPYGMKRTREWMAAIAEVLGVELGDAWERERIGAEWDGFVREAGEFRLGFVIDDSKLEILSKPELFTGVPLLRAVEEMGFGIDLLVYRGDGISGIDELIDDPSRLRVREFDSRESLHELLRAESPHAVYSNIFFDRRLTLNGKGQFSFASFEMGFRGAVRTVERLLAVCRLPFYRKYSMYLRPDFDRGVEE